MMKTTIVKNRKIPTLYELGLYGYFGGIALISVILSYPLSTYFLEDRNNDLCLAIFITVISSSLVFVAFIICGGIPLTEWLDEKERNEGNNFNKYIF